MFNKKLTLVGDDREFLKRALRETANTADQDTCRLCDITIRSIPIQKTPADEIVLTEKQQEVVKSALKSYERNHGAHDEITRMLCQLTMSPEEFKKWRNWLLSNRKA